MKRRAALIAAAGVGAALVAARFAVPRVLRVRPVRAVETLSTAARELVAACFADVDPELLLDAHLHVVGVGDGGTGCHVNPEMQSHTNPIQRLKYEAYLAASGLDEHGHIDADYLERLLELTAAFPTGSRFALLAFDWFHGEDGQRREDLSTFFVPNDYVASFCQANPRMTFFASVHPYRADALSELDRLAALGARGVKWLPNAMGIDPLDERCGPYFDRMRELGLLLLSHAGHELAVNGDAAQALGNPLRLRKPLDHGVTVLIAHCASLGMSEDLDHPERVPVASIDLFLRLMKEPRYEGKLFGDISATTLQNREPGLVRTLIEQSELHARLVNGSDYPVIAIDPLVNLGSYRDAGLLGEEELPALGEIYAANALLGDFVLKRRFRVVDGGGARRLPPQIFEGGRLLRRT